MKAKKSVSMKVLVLMMALVLLIGCGIGGTLAWLMAKTNSVTNTFVVGEIGDLTLSENGEEITTDKTVNDFVIIPGKDLQKNVTVSYSYKDVDGDDFSEVPVYVFVKINTTDWSTTDHLTYSVMEGTETLVSWTIADGWSYLETTGTESVYYRAVAAGASLEDVPVIAKVAADSQTHIEVSDKITMDNIDEVSAAAGSLTFTAYAIQQEGFETPALAWAEASKTT